MKLLYTDIQFDMTEILARKACFLHRSKLFVF